MQSSHPQSRPHWHNYALASAITIGALVLRLLMPGTITADRPLLILFVVPMLFSAYLGGLGPGLLSTALVAIGTVLLLFSPSYGFAFTRPLNLAQWLILLATGVLGSILCESLHRARRKAELIIQKLKESERALRESQQLLQAISNNSTTVIYAKDLAGRYLMANRRYTELLHLSEGSVVGHTDYEIFPEGAADAFRAMDERVVAAGVALTAEEVVPHDDGPHTYVSMKSPLRDAAGKIFGVFGISTDISDRKRTEEALRASEERTRSIVETALDAVITIDTTGVITGWSPQAEKTFGWPANDAIGRSLAQTIIPEKYRAAHTRGMQRYLATGEAAVLNRRVELTALRRDGREFPVELAITPIRLDSKLSFSAFVRDITERHQTEAMLAAREQQYRSIFEQSPLPKWIYDLETLRFLAVNKTAQVHYGYSEAEFLAMTIRDIRPPDELPALEADVAHAREAANANASEWRHRTKDGRTLDVIVNAHDVTFNERRARLVAVQDITERKQAENALRESEERFRALVTASSDVVYRMNADWSEMRQLRGRDFLADTEAPSRDWLHEYIAPEDQPRVLAAIKTAIQTKNIFSLEHQVRRVNGSLGWTFSRAVPLLNPHGEIVEWFGAASDITARKQAEAKLQTQVAQLNLLHQITRAIGERQDLQSIFQVVVRSLEDNLPIDLCCMCLYDAADHVLTVTRVGVHSATLATELALTEQSRIPIDENGLSRCVRGHLVHEPDIADVRFPFPQRLARGGLRSLVFAPLLVESQVFGVFIGARRTPHSFTSGECEFLKQLSEHTALAANQAQLYGALQRAYDDLRQTQQAIMQQERLRALGQMASGIAHDINNAISPATLYVESLLENEANIAPKARERLSVIQHALDDVAQTVARMREFYRQREPQLELAALDVNQLVPQVVELSRARWHDMPQQRGVVIELRTELAPNLPAIKGVESEIREALINLVFNAVDAMPEGGTLMLRTRSVTDSLPTHVAVDVIDTGVGMDADTRRRCLEPFFTTKGERGTGLGLAMVYGMVQRHNADIQIESAIGHGTMVRLSFAAPNNVTQPNPSAAVAAPRTRLRLLIVDDDPLLIKSLRDTLEADGHVIATANDGRSGIDAFLAALARNEPFAAVITDLGMPYVDGRKVASEIKAASPQTPVILLTGWGQRLVAENDVPPHVDIVLSKPPKLRELREALAKFDRE